MSFADKGVTLPVAQAGATRYDNRVFINGYPVWQLSPAIVGTTALSALFPATRMAEQLALLLFVTKDIWVDPLMTDRDESL